MWPTTVMEILFAGSMVSLLAEIGGRRSLRLLRYGPGLTAIAAIASSLLVLSLGWADSLGAQMQLQPVQSFFASLYVADRYTAFMGFTVLVISLAVAVYALHYFGPLDRPGPFYALLTTLSCSLLGVISAGDFLTLFLFWEGMSLSGYGLAAFGRAHLSVEAAVKYFLMAGVGSLVALYGIAAIYISTGSILLQAVPVALGTGFGGLGVALLLLGLGVEAAVVPVHTWLPDVYAGSSLPVSALVSGAMTGTGVFALFKVLQPLVPGGGFGTGLQSLVSGAANLQLFLAGLAFATMLVGNLSALAQSNLRRLLSFSSIAQTGYMLAALSTLSVAGLVAAVFTIWNHGLLKSNFFMLMGDGESSLESSSLESLKGRGRGDRRLGFLYASSSLGMVGAPPFGMFWSEILVVQSLLLAGGPTHFSMFSLLAASVVLNIVLSIGYYYRVINTVVFGEPGQPTAARSLVDLAPSLFLLGASVATGLAPFLIIGNVL